MTTLPPRPQTPDRRERLALQVLVGGMLGLVVVMGIGRFAFTPILPLMQRDLGMSHTVAGWLAGLNYLGYLGGAMLCSVFPGVLRSRALAAGALLVSIASTLCMAWTVSEFWWGVMRCGGGLATAVLFIVISAEVAESLSRYGCTRWGGALYGGVGLGIALSGLVVPWLDRLGGWRGSWTGMGLVAILLAWLGLRLGRQRRRVGAVTAPKRAPAGSLKQIALPAAAYFFEGLGYIVTATFLVAIIAVTPGLEGFAPYSWVAVGLAAAPSTLFWPRLARRYGQKRALLAAYLLQAAGILVSANADSMLEVAFAAFTFGGTFMGIVAMTLAEGQLRVPANGGWAAAVLTASFSIGQVLGPVLAGTLADSQQGFFWPLLLAAGCVLAGGLFILADRRYRPPAG